MPTDDLSPAPIPMPWSRDGVLLLEDQTAFYGLPFGWRGVRMGEARVLDFLAIVPGRKKGGYYAGYRRRPLCGPDGKVIMRLGQPQWEWIPA